MTLFTCSRCHRTASVDSTVDRVHCLSCHQWNINPWFYEIVLDASAKTS